jgi:F-type H+-transporting ATPase subunit epsilon
MPKPMQCIVVTPEQTALQQEADFVALPLYDGEIGIAPNHSPMIGRLGFGEMRIRAGGATATYYLDGGFVQVADNVVSVLTNRAVPADKVEGDAAELALAKAASLPTGTAEQREIKERAVAQARAQLRMARHRRI